MLWLSRPCGRPETQGERGRGPLASVAETVSQFVEPIGKRVGKDSAAESFEAGQQNGEIAEAGIEQGPQKFEIFVAFQP